MTSYTGHIKGSLNLRPGDDASGVTRVDGNIFVYGCVDGQLPLCKSVGRGIWVYPGSSLKLPVCESVGGDIFAYSGTYVELPSFLRAGIAGEVWRGKGARVELP